MKKEIDFSKYEFRPTEELFRFAMVPLKLRGWCDYETALVKEWLEFAKKMGKSTNVTDWYELREKPKYNCSECNDTGWKLRSNGMIPVEETNGLDPETRFKSLPVSEPMIKCGCIK